MSSALVLLSGGCDSATLLYYVKHFYKYSNIRAIGFNYGQKHLKELDCARTITKQCVICPFDIITCDLTQFGGSCLTTSEDIPKEKEDKQYATIVPARNSIFLSLATAYAEVNKIDDIFIGCVLDDFKSYPDCRQDFITSMSNALSIGNNIRGVYAPFINTTKADIIKWGLESNVEYEYTWTCYKGESKPCLECDACVERIEAMKKNGRDYNGNNRGPSYHLKF